ncbi:MAG TPA: zinc ribbon domain-containing protein [Caldithrix sp.]|nr:zinc ribbon domain-containing protein [Caldithrix sp.]
MPTYRYHCKTCGYEFEKFSSISSYNKQLECPVCHNLAELAISGGSGLIFKGSGFYETDYKNHHSITSNGKSKSDKK